MVSRRALVLSIFSCSVLPILPVRSAIPSQSREASTLEKAYVTDLVARVREALEIVYSYVYTEPNSPITQGIVLGWVGSCLQTLQANKILHAYKVVCDDSNNPPSVLHELPVVDISIRAINETHEIRIHSEQNRSG